MPKKKHKPTIGRPPTRSPDFLPRSIKVLTSDWEAWGKYAERLGYGGRAALIHAAVAHFAKRAKLDIPPAFGENTRTDSAGQVT